MGINFPSAPAVGETYPTPAQPGLPQWTWNGSAWKSGNNDTSSYVLKTGDVMTGDLTITKAGPALYLNKTATAQDVAIMGQNAGKNRWLIDLGTTAAESGSNLGSNLQINRYDDAGVYLGTPMTIERATGRPTFAADVLPTGSGAINLGSATQRWATIYTSDLDLNNGIGDWTIVEGEEDLFIYNNKKGRVYKFALIEVDPSMAPLKKV
jgi:hypothetical protein